MFSRPRSALLVALIVSLALGWFVAGHYAYEIYVSLDESAFPAGAVLQEMVSWLVGPDLEWMGPGLALFALTALAAGAISFALVWAAARTDGGRAAPGRRRFLAGAGAALVSVLITAGLGFVRALYGLGRGGGGWKRVDQEIFGDRSGIDPTIPSGNPAPSSSTGTWPYPEPMPESQPSWGYPWPSTRRTSRPGR